MDIDHSTLLNLSRPVPGEDSLLERIPQDEVPPEPAADAEEASGSMLDERFAVLEARLHELLRLFEQMVQENQDLRVRHAELRAECEHLQQSRDQAQARLEAMVLRLRSLEPSA